MSVVHFQHTVIMDKRNNIALPTNGYFIKLAQVHFTKKLLYKHVYTMLFRVQTNLPNNHLEYEDSSVA